MTTLLSVSAFAQFGIVGGLIMEEFPTGCWTNHHSLVEHKGDFLNPDNMFEGWYVALERAGDNSACLEAGSADIDWIEFK